MVPRASRRSFLFMMIAMLSLLGLQAVLASDLGTQPAASEWVYEEGKSDPDAVTHQVPNVPIKIDGEKREAKEIKKHDGKPLYSVWDANAEAEGTLYVFTSKKKYQEYLAANGLSDAVKSPTKATAQNYQQRAGTYHNDETNRTTYFYEDVSYGDDRLLIYDGGIISDLRERSRSGCCFRTWNDAISSVRTTPWGAGTTLYTDIWFEGSEFFIQARRDIPDLRVYGWNDRASSIWVAAAGPLSPTPTPYPTPVEYPTEFPTEPPCEPEPGDPIIVPIEPCDVR